MVCPKCGSQHVVSAPVTETTTSGKVKGFGCIKACLGWLIFSFPGILCGLCGMGKGKTRTVTKTSVVHVCQNCGFRY